MKTKPRPKPEIDELAVEPEGGKQTEIYPPGLEVAHIPETKPTQGGYCRLLMRFWEMENGNISMLWDNPDHLVLSKLTGLLEIVLERIPRGGIVPAHISRVMFREPQLLFEPEKNVSPTGVVRLRVKVAESADGKHIYASWDNPDRLYSSKYRGMLRCAIQCMWDKVTEEAQRLQNEKSAQQAVQKLQGEPTLWDGPSKGSK